MKNNIKRIIKQKGHTQKEIAKKLNIRESTLSDWIKEKRVPSLESAYELSKILQCRVDDLIVKDADYLVKIDATGDDLDHELLLEIKSFTESEKKQILGLAKLIKLQYNINRSALGAEENARLAQLEEHLTLNEKQRIREIGFFFLEKYGNRAIIGHTKGAAAPWMIDKITA